MSSGNTNSTSVKGAVVTGAASGIGLATAKLLASRGHAVLFADRDVEKGEKEAASAGQQFCHVDVSDESSIKKLVEKAKEVLPNVSFLVNSAGCDFYGPFDKSYSSAAFDRAIQVNLRSVFLMCRDMLPLLKETRGAIVSVASIQGHRSFSDFSVYAATKSGMIGMTRQLAGDLAQFGVRVNTVSPGAVHTNLGMNSCKFEGQSGEPDDFVFPKVENDGLLGCLDASDVADAIASMLSLRGVTGQDLIVDGGCSAIGVPWWNPFPKPDDYPQIVSKDSDSKKRKAESIST